MHNLNNVDIIILIVIGISALIALSRGLVKEVLSIVGWILGTFAVIYLLPILNPITSRYIMSGFVSGIVTSLFILIGFLVCWILLTGQLVGKVRSSKLNGFDRFLGLFFGVARAFLLVILANILISWMVPRDKQSPALTESKYFQIAGNFAEPIEKLIPEDTLEEIRKKTSEISSEEDDEKAKKEKTEADILFEKLAQPKLKKKKDEVKKEVKQGVKKTIKKLEKEEKRAKNKEEDKKKEIKKETITTPVAKPVEEPVYDNKERQGLNDLIDSVHE